MSGPADPRKLAAWRERLERFWSSGLSVARFGARERIAVASFYHWRKKLGIKGRPAPRSLLGRQGRGSGMTDGHPRRRTEGQAVRSASEIERRITDGHPRHRTGSAGGVAAGERAADFFTLVSSAVGRVLFLVEIQDERPHGGRWILDKPIKQGAVS